jgi:hypothetical protein
MNLTKATSSEAIRIHQEEKNSVKEEKNSSDVRTESPRDAPESRVWFNVYPALNRITEVEVEKVTEASVVIQGRRHARATESEFYEPTLEAAKARLIDYHEMKVSKAATMLGVRQRDLERAREPQIKSLPARAGSGDNNG